MKKLTLLLLLTCSIISARAQVISTPSADSARVGKADGTSGIALYGDIYLKNTIAGLLRLNADRKFVTTTLTSSDIPNLPQSKITGLGDSLSSKYSKNQISLTAPGVVTLSTGAGALTGGEYFVGVVPVSADGGEGSFDFIGYMLTNTITVSAAQGINTIWKTVPNAVAYRVYVGKSGYTNYKRYYETTDTTYTVAIEPAGRVGTVTITPSDSGGILKKGYYYFAVSAVFSNGETADQTLDGNYPFAYVNTDAGSVGLSWTAITGATSYKVYVVSETDGNSRVHTKYFTTPSNSVTVRGNETYIRGLGALTKGSREHSTDNVGVFGSIYTTSNSRSQFQADIQISAVKNADAAFQANRYTNFNFAGLDMREGGSNKWRWGMGGSNDSTRNMELLRNGLGADPAIRFSHTADSIRIWWPLYSSASALFTQSSQGIGGGYGIFRNTANRTYIGVTNSSGTSFATGGLANATFFGTRDAVPIQFGMHDTVRVTFLETGNAGVGTNVPVTPWHVATKNAFSINGSYGSVTQQSSGEVESIVLGYIKSDGQIDGNAIGLEVQHNASAGASSAFMRPYFRNNDNSGRFVPGRLGWTKVAAENSSTWKVTTTNAGVENNGIAMDKSGNVTIAGIVTGSNLSGTNTGDQTTVTGNAGSATVLQTARTIGGVSFNGSANITVASATGGFAVSGGDITSTNDIILNNGSVLRGKNTGASNRRLISIEADDKIHIAQSDDDVVFGSGVVTFPTSPIVPAPTGSTDAANKAYVDAATSSSGRFTKIQTISANTTLDATYHTILADSSSGSITITLPSAADASVWDSANSRGITYYIKKTSASNNVVIDPPGSETIDGSSSRTLVTPQYIGLSVTTNGTNWFITSTIN